LAKNLDRNAEALAADVLAVKVVIGQVPGRIHELDPVLAEAIEGGFADAANEIRARATEASKGTGAKRVVNAIATIESLRAAVLSRSGSHVQRTVANDIG
jgi:hypothetical protein